MSDKPEAPNVMQQMALNAAIAMAERLIGPQMPKIMEAVKRTIEKVNAFDDRLAAIEKTGNDIQFKLNTMLNGGPSMGERMALGVGFIVDTDAPLQEPLEVMMRKAGDDGSIYFNGGDCLKNPDGTPIIIGDGASINGG